MTTISLSSKESVTVSAQHGQVNIHLIQGFLAMSKRITARQARELAQALNAAADQLLRQGVTEAVQG